MFRQSSCQRPRSQFPNECPHQNVTVTNLALATGTTLLRSLHQIPVDVSLSAATGTHLEIASQLWTEVRHRCVVGGNGVVNGVAGCAAPISTDRQGGSAGTRAATRFKIRRSATGLCPAGGRRRSPRRYRALSLKRKR